MNELSIFVDESGHFDMDSKDSPYYIVTFIKGKALFEMVSNKAGKFGGGES